MILRFRFGVGYWLIWLIIFFSIFLMIFLLVYCKSIDLVEILSSWIEGGNIYIGMGYVFINVSINYFFFF